MDSLGLYLENEDGNNRFSHLQPSPSYPSFSTVPRYKIQNFSNAKIIKNVFKKIAGIPLALLYGFIFAIIMKYMILGDLPRNLSVTSRVKYNFRKANFSCLNDSNITFTLASSQKNESVNPIIPIPEDNRNLAYMTSAFTFTIGVASIFSRGTRCSMLLILPGLITRRSRTFVFTFIMGLLADGPINSLSYNLHQIVENTACIYEAISRMTCKNGEHLDRAMKYIQEIEVKIVEMIKGFYKPTNDIVELKLNFEPNFIWPDLKNLIQAPNLAAIKDKVYLVIKGLSEFRSYAAIFRKLLTILSILLMVIDAVQYLRLYYSDYSYDNMYIGKNILDFWEENGYEEVTPIRNWEKNEGFHVKRSIKFTKRELYMTLRNALPTFLFSVFATLVMITDYLLAQLLQFIIDKERFSVSFDGMEHNFGLAKLKLRHFHIGTEICLAQPLYTSVYVNIGICLFLIIAAISCVFEVYTSTIRAKMCNLFYNKSFRERADYLHCKILNGRKNRRRQLTYIIKNEIERRERLAVFFPWSSLANLYRETFPKKYISCPGCGWGAHIKESQCISFTLDERKVKNKLCKNCFLDYEDYLVT